MESIYSFFKRCKRKFKIFGVFRKAACSLIKEIVKHSPELAQMVVEAGGLGVKKILIEFFLSYKN